MMRTQGRLAWVGSCVVLALVGFNERLTTWSGAQTAISNDITRLDLGEYLPITSGRFFGDHLPGFVPLAVYHPNFLEIIFYHFVLLGKSRPINRKNI